MLGAWSIPLCLSCLGAEPDPDGPRVEPAAFRRWFVAAREGTLPIPAEVERRAQGFRYVFVAGLLNERMPAYFGQNAQELKARGVPRGAIHFIYPSSSKTCEENAEEVRAQFLKIAREGREPLVVIAHSRGACDALAFALADPKFVRDHLHALFLVQGPFGGTGLADYVAGDGPAMDREIPLRFRAVGTLIGRAEKKRLKRGKDGGLTGLTRKASARFWDQILDDHAEAIPIVDKKTFYVTTETSPSHFGLFKRATAWYLQAIAGPNDGLVALEDQSLPELGTVLAVLDAGHTDLTNRFPSAHGARRLRRALIQSILMAVGRADAEDGAPDPAAERNADEPTPETLPPAPDTARRAGPERRRSR